jgi:hypothetical protein
MLHWYLDVMKACSGFVLMSIPPKIAPYMFQLYCYTGLGLVESGKN